MSIVPLETDSKFVHSAVANSCMCKRPPIELCAPLAIRFRIANSCTRWRSNFKGHSLNGGRADLYKNLYASLFNDDLSKKPRNFKGLSQNGGGADFYKKNLCASLFNDGLLNEPKFGQIYIA
jgi:hypothetical protein